MDKIGLQIEITPEILKISKTTGGYREKFHSMGRILMDSLSPELPLDEHIILTLTAEPKGYQATLAKIDGDEVVFSTGKRVYVNRGIIGISPELQISGGYDDGVDDDLTPKEKRELANYAIKQWAKLGGL